MDQKLKMVSEHIFKTWVWGKNAYLISVLNPET